MSGIARIACIGEVMIELIMSEAQQVRLAVGGDTYNTAVYLSMLSKGSSTEVTYVTALGKDQFSETILEDLRMHGIRDDLIEQREDRHPGLYAIQTDDTGERSFSYWRDASAARTLFSEPCSVHVDHLREQDLVYLSGITLAILPEESRQILMDFLRSFRKDGGKVAFDSNYRKRLWPNAETARRTMMEMWSITDIALPSLDDELTLHNETDPKETLKRLADAGVTYGALKRGEAGPVALGETISQVTFEPVRKVVDTTAAGDSFNAGFLYEHARGSSLAEALLAGHRLASRVIQKNGAIVDLEE